MERQASGSDRVGSRGRVLVVDDSVVIRAIIGHTLRSAGFAVREAEHGGDAVRALARDAFDVVVTDLQMPVLDGMGVLQWIRERGLATQVIVLTGACAGDFDTARGAIKLGAHALLSKPPAGPKVVIQAVDKAVEAKRVSELAAHVVRHRPLAAAATV